MVYVCVCVCVCFLGGMGMGCTETEGNHLNHGFSSDLLHLMGKMHVWAYGHTHFNNRRMVSGTLLMSNQMGYPEEKDTSYRIDAQLDLTEDIASQL